MRQDHRNRNAEQECTFSYYVRRPSMRILELENRCTGNRTVGSNPTSPISPIEAQGFAVNSEICATTCAPTRAAQRPAEGAPTAFGLKSRLVSSG